MRNVHFVGSVALDTPEEVYAAIGQHCGRYVKRVPDGEPGGRRLWISWQIPGYCREARASYEDFLKAREAGHLPPTVRFQVSLQPPLAVVMPFGFHLYYGDLDAKHFH